MLFTSAVGGFSVEADQCILCAFRQHNIYIVTIYKHETKEEVIIYILIS